MEENHPMPARGGGGGGGGGQNGGDRWALFVLCCLLLVLGMLLPRLFTPRPPEADSGPCRTIYLMDGTPISALELQNLVQTEVEDEKADSGVEDVTGDRESPRAQREPAPGESSCQQPEDCASEESPASQSAEDSRQVPGGDDGLPEQDSGSDSGNGVPKKDSDSEPGKDIPKKDSDSDSGKDTPKEESSSGSRKDPPKGKASSDSEGKLPKNDSTPDAKQGTSNKDPSQKA